MNSQLIQKLTREDTEKQVFRYPGCRYRGFTVNDGGKQRAKEEYEAFVESLQNVEPTVPLDRKDFLQDEEQDDTILPTLEALLSGKGLNTCTPLSGQTLKRKRATTAGEELSLRAAVSPDTRDELTSTINLEKSNVFDIESPESRDHQELDWIPLEAASDYGSIDEYDDASIDEYFSTSLSKPLSKPLSTEPALCKEQADLVSLIMSGRNTFYTGSAGCGKSTVLKAFVNRLKDARKQVNIVAPTGRAALDVNGSTTWTYAGWTPDHMKRPLSKLLEAAHGKFVYKRLKKTDVLVIDEISMLENHHFERLNRLMKEARHSDQAFGGVQVIVTGDFCQLPPVEAISVLPLLRSNATK